MNNAIDVRGLLNLRAVVSRPIARTLGEHLASKIGPGAEQIVLDFSGVVAVSPSFLDELFGVFEEVLENLDRQVQILMINTPDLISLKIALITRGHNLAVTEEGPSTWRIAKSTPRVLST